MLKIRIEMPKTRFKRLKTRFERPKTRFERPKTRFSGILLEWTPVHWRRKKKPDNTKIKVLYTLFEQDDLDDKKCKKML